MGSLGLKQGVLKAQLGPPSGQHPPPPSVEGKIAAVPPGSCLISSTIPGARVSYAPSDWPGLGHVFIPEPIALSKSMDYADWPGLSHMLT